MSDDQQSDDRSLNFDEDRLNAACPVVQGNSMRPDHEVAIIIQTIRGATLPPVPEPEPERRSCFWLPPDFRRALALAQSGRLGKMIEMARALAAAAGTPEWVARMALDAVYLPGREADLDCSGNDAPALELALLAMGINPEAVTWSVSVLN